MPLSTYLTRLNGNFSDYAMMASLAYEQSKEKRTYDVNGWGFEGDGSYNNASGFEAQAYKNGNNITIAIAGTNGDLADWTQGNFSFSSLTPVGQQIFDAIAYVENIKANNDGADISFTGHSLGGGIAQVLAAIYGGEALAFDAPGAMAIINDASFLSEIVAMGLTLNIADSNVLNIVEEGSFVSGIGEHFGDIYSVNTQANILSPHLKSIWPVVVGAAELADVLDQHSMGSFVELARGTLKENAGDINQVILDRLNDIGVPTEGFTALFDIWFNDQISVESGALWPEFQNLGETLDGMLTNLGDFKDNISQFAQDTALGFSDWVSDFYESATDNLIPNLIELGEKVASFNDKIEAFKDFIEKTGQDVAETLDSWINNLIDSSSANVLDSLLSLSNNANDFIDSIKNAFTFDLDFTIPGSFAEFFRDMKIQLDKGATSIYVGGRRIDPLVMDLDGDGVETVSINQGVVFDHSADGVRESTGWVAADDGMLVLDINSNGTIDNGRELFGDNTLLSDGSKAKDGFEALKDYDTNNDGLIDDSDEVFSQLQVWQDANQDGISQVGELKTLTDLGITSINVDDTVRQNYIQNGNQLASMGSFTRNGNEYSIAQVNYFSDNFKTSVGEKITLSDAAKLLPDVQGSGGLKSLREAATLDSNLAELVKQFATATTSQTQQGLVNEILWLWAQTSTGSTLYDIAKNYNSSNTNNVIYQPFAMSQLNSQTELGKLSIIATFMGNDVLKNNALQEVSTYSWNDELNDYVLSGVSLINRVTVDQNSLDDTFQQLSDSVYGSLIIQTRLKPYLDGMDLVFSVEGDITWDHSATLYLIETKLASDQTSGLIDLIELTKFSGQEILSKGFNIVSYLEQTINGVLMTAELKALLAEVGLSNTTTNNNDVFFASETNDIIDGMSGNDVLYGLAGGDSLNGGDGNDILTGGTGNDILQGGEGNDIYLFSLGDGQDIIQNFEAGETLQFLAGITQSNLTFSRDDTNLYVTTDVGDKITVNNFFNEDYRENTVRFDDGMVLTGQDIANLLYQATNADDELYGNYDDATLNGLAGNDKLYGGIGDDTLNGGSDDDILYGGDGADVLDGGAGNDYLSGGASSDTYLFGRGSGQDTISLFYTGLVGQDVLQFADDVLSTDISLTRTNDDLIIQINDTDDNVTIKGYFTQSQYQEINIKFPDDQNWNFETIKQMMINGYDSDNNIVGYDGDDVINGNDESETIDGKDGNDIISGNGGDDVIDGNRGNDNLNGGAGNDTLIGGWGEDTLTGGKGDDILQGGYGDDDIYIFAQGDGKDTIIESKDEQNVNIILKLQNITSDNVIYRRQGYNLVLTFLNNSDDQITITDYFDANQETRNKSLSLYIDDENQNLTDEILQDKLIASSALNDTIEADARGNTIDGLAGDDVIYGRNGNDVLSGDVGDDLLYGGNNNDQLNGGIGDDTLDGGYGNDTLLGEIGNDTLLGNTGDDFLNAGLGNDIIKGGSGADVYLFAKGDGVDFVKDSNGTDRFEFTDIDSTEVSIRRNNYDNLVLTFANSNDKITIDNQFYSGLSSQNVAGIESFTFADGVTWNAADIFEQSVKGTDSNDTIYGFNFADSINAGLGDDTVYAESGDDVVYGGLGNDTIILGYGNDQAWGGDGDDTISVKDLENNIIGDDGNNQLFGDAGNDMLTGGTGNDILEGGTGTDTLKGNSGNDILKGDAGDDILQGGSGDDQLFGGDGNDTLEAGFGADILDGGAGDDILISFDDNSDRSNKTLIAGKGNDTLYGSFGDDTYQFNLGDGQDRIIETRQEQAYSNYAASNDTLVFGEGINASDLSFEKSGADLLIKVGSGEDSITIENWFQTYTEHFLVNTLLFSDGTTLNVSQINDLVVQVGTDGDEQLVGSNNNDTISGLGGNDQIFAQGGDDVLLGGTGDDYLDGGAGNDRLEGGAGNDQLRGKAGNDLLIGGIGDDAYVIGVDEGHDVLDVADGGQDVMYLQGINKEQLTFSQDGDDLLIKVDDGTAQSIRVKNHFLGGDAAIDFIQTGDNQLLSTTDINQLVNADNGTTEPEPSVITGTDVGEQLTGTSDNDTINGLAGDDQLSGMAGDDVLSGGLGNDMLIGGAGDDSYVVAASEGHDQINTADGGVDSLTFEGINRDQVTFEQSGDDLLVLIDGGAEQSVRILGYFNGSDAEIDNVQFASGEQLTAADINQIIADANENGGGGTTPPDNGGNEPTTPTTGGDDQISGGITNDILVGGAGNDRLAGGLGNDQLFGGSGDDTFVFAKGDGQDVIEVNTGTNVLEFTNDISWNDVASGLSKYGNDLVLNIAGGSDKVTIKEFFTYGTAVLNDIKLADGSNITPAQIFGAFGLAMPTATPAADISVQYGDLLDNVLDGTTGADVINGQSGNDTITGGLGNDTLIGGQGDDTFVINSGDGQDIIDSSGGGVDSVLFKSGISFNDMASTLMKKGNDLQLGSGDTQVTIRNFFLGGDFAVDNFTFESGGQFSAAQIFGAFGLAVPNIAETDQSINLPDLNQFSQVLQGDASDQGLYASSGDELLLGAAGNDVLSGGAGNDTLIGGTGNDSYLFALGDGQDVINNYDSSTGNSDVLQLAANITSSDVSLTRTNDDLVISINGTDDQVSIQNYFANNGVSDYSLSAINFTDGTSWGLTEVNNLLTENEPSNVINALSIENASRISMYSNSMVDDSVSSLLHNNSSFSEFNRANRFDEWFKLELPIEVVVDPTLGGEFIELPPELIGYERGGFIDLPPEVIDTEQLVDTAVNVGVDASSALFDWPAYVNNTLVELPTEVVVGPTLGGEFIELPPELIGYERGGFIDLPPEVIDTEQLIDTAVNVGVDASSALFDWPAYVNNTLVELPTEVIVDPNLGGEFIELPPELIGYERGGFIDLPPEVIDTEQLIDTAVNQLVQAHASFADIGDEVEVGKFDNSYRNILPVLEPAD